MRRISAVIFDMDGIIVDSEPIQLESFNEILSKYNISITPSEFREFVGKTQPYIFDELKNRYRIDENIETLMENKKASYVRLATEKMKPNDGLIELLSWLGLNKIKIGIASSSPILDITTIIELLDIQSQFDKIISSIGLPNNKPFPDVYLKAAYELGKAPENCIAIEDSGIGVEAAKRAGMLCIAMPNFYTIEQDFTKADYVIKSLFDVKTIISGYITQKCNKWF